MRANGIEIDDLYEYVLPHAAEWQTADGVHFNVLGNARLGERVSAAIFPP